MAVTTDDIGQIVTDIWTTMLGFPVASRSDPVDVNGDRNLSASVQISGGWDGTVLVSCPEQLARRAAAAMFDAEEASDEEMRDALGEIANMTAGNVKSHIEAYCRLSLPMVAEGKELLISIPGSTVVAEAAFDCGEDAFSVEVYEKG
ncbi:MAG TPA: chemotaxis protein CheX [Actinomycetota bacterium]|nr:chemotaxis protein CheX [Actinomycetota bacterium]